MEEIIKQKKGELIKKSNSIFEEHQLKCHNHHTFTATENDILHGKWCTQCDDKIATIYIERCKMLEDSPPEKNWAGIWKLTEK